MKIEINLYRQNVFMCVGCAVRIGEGLSVSIKKVGKECCACEHIGIKDIGNYLGWKEEDK